MNRIGLTINDLISDTLRCLNAYLHQGEMLTPSRCGRMDQCVVMGPGAVGIMQFPGSTCSLRKLTLGGDTRAVEEGSERKCSGLYFVVVDLKAGKDTVTILRELNHCFPFPQNDTQVL